MTSQTSAPALKPNIFRASCSICGTRVPAQAGFRIGSNSAGGYKIQCAPCCYARGEVTPPKSLPDAPRVRCTCGAVQLGNRTCTTTCATRLTPTRAPAMKTPKLTRPEISDRAVKAACALFVRADADRNDQAMTIARELVAACCYARGEAMPELTATPNVRPEDRSRFQAAAAGIVDDLLGGRSTDAEDDARVAADLSDCETAFADAPSRGPTVAAERTNRDATRRTAAAKPARDRWAHRRK